jgi:hypothetical protein
VAVAVALAVPLELATGLLAVLVVDVVVVELATPGLLLLQAASTNVAAAAAAAPNFLPILFMNSPYEEV